MAEDESPEKEDVVTRDGHGDGTADIGLGIADTAQEVQRNLLVFGSIHCHKLPDRHIPGTCTVHQAHDRVDHMAEFEGDGRDNSSADVDTDCCSELAKWDIEGDGGDDGGGGGDAPVEQADAPMLVVGNSFGYDGREMTPQAFYTAMAGKENDGCRSVDPNDSWSLGSERGGDNSPNLPRLYWTLSGQICSSNEME